MEYLVKDIEDVERICRAHGKHVIFLMSIDGHSEFVLSGVTFDSYDVDEIGYSFSATAENYCQVMPEEINRYKEGEGEIILYGRGKKIPIFYQCINIKNGIAKSLSSDNDNYCEINDEKIEIKGYFLNRSIKNYNIKGSKVLEKVENRFEILDIED